MAIIIDLPLYIEEDFFINFEGKQYKKRETTLELYLKGEEIIKKEISSEEKLDLFLNLYFQIPLDELKKANSILKELIFNKLSEVNNKVLEECEKILSVGNENGKKQETEIEKTKNQKKSKK